MNKKRCIYIASLLLAFVASGCSNEELTPANQKQYLPLEGVILSMNQSEITNPITRTSVTYTVNTVKDPTKTTLKDRKDWLLDFTLYNGTIKYNAGSFEGGKYDATKSYWTGPGATQYYFPNYLSPGVEVLVYPTSYKDAISDTQSSKENIIAQDVLMQKNNKEEFPKITPAHIIIKGNIGNNTKGIHLIHKHAMLDFAITDINPTEIDKVTVEITKNSSTITYTPYEVPNLTGMKEYMLILPEGTDVNPIIHITTKAGDQVDAIKYKQELKVISDKYKTLGTNNCFCFTLKGKALELSPITVADWARGQAIEGEYIAVTAYPTFKAPGHAGETYYFYYDNKLKEGGKDKLQEIKFNENAECTIKPDGRILTHIYKPNDVEAIAESKNMTPKAGSTPTTANIVLSQMIIDLQSKLPTIP